MDQLTQIKLNQFTSTHNTITMEEENVTHGGTGGRWGGTTKL